MTINGSRIIGPIQDQTEVLLVGRLGERYYTYTDKGFVNFGTTYNDDYYVFRVDFSSDGLEMTARKAYRLFSKKPYTKPGYRHLEEVFSQKKYKGRVFAIQEKKPNTLNQDDLEKREIENKFKLMQTETKVPGDKLFAGIWYKFISGKSENILFRVYEPCSGEGFAEKFGTPILTDLEITFVPYDDTSMFHENTCCAKSNQIAFRFFESWVKGENLSKHCNGSLNGNSQNCVFTGSTCLNKEGYRYCNIDEQCGKCYGICENGGSCISNGESGKFYCHTVNEPANGKKSVNYRLLEIISIIVFVLIVVILLMIYANRK